MTRYLMAAVTAANTVAKRQASEKKEERTQVIDLAPFYEPVPYMYRVDISGYVYLCSAPYIYARTSLLILNRKTRRE